MYIEYAALVSESSRKFLAIRMGGYPTRMLIAVFCAHSGDKNRNMHYVGVYSDIQSVPPVSGDIVREFREAYEERNSAGKVELHFNGGQTVSLDSCGYVRYH